jgi:hypothetical protein
MPNPKDPKIGDEIKSLGELSLPEIASMQLKALKTGNLSEVVRTLEATIPPEPAREEPVRLAFRVPVTHVGGERAIGQALVVTYDGEGPLATVSFGDVSVRVSAAKLSTVMMVVSQMSQQLRSYPMMPPGI